MRGSGICYRCQSHANWLRRMYPIVLTEPDGVVKIAEICQDCMAKLFQRMGASDAPLKGEECSK